MLVFALDGLIATDLGAICFSFYIDAAMPRVVLRVAMMLVANTNLGNTAV